jgi:hypothetical protein
VVALAKLSVPTHQASPFLVSSPVAFKFLNVLVLNIAEKFLAGRYTPINQSINQQIQIQISYQFNVVYLYKGDNVAISGLEHAKLKYVAPSPMVSKL